MGIFIKVLQGSYAYLLIFEILIVSLLFLTFLWMLVRRVKEAGNTLGAALPLDLAPAERQGSSIAVVAEATQTLSDLKEQVDALDTQTVESDKINRLNNELRDKVKYLESKLLEYEILQEEIGTLSTLKAENEELRQQLVQLVKPKPSRDTKEFERPASEPDTISANGVPADEEKKEPSFAASASVENEEKTLVGDIPEVAPMVDNIEKTLVGEPSSPPPEQTESADSSEGPSVAGLEKLLAQIDELTKSPPPTGK